MAHSRVLIQVSCKVLGLWFLITSANMFVLFFPQAVSMSFASGNGSPPPGTIYQSFAFPIVHLIFAFILLKYAAAIAQKLDNANQEISIALDEEWPTKLYNIGIRLIGVYVVIKGLPDIIAQISHLLMRSQTVSTLSKLPLSAWGPLIATILFFLLGLHLLAGGSLLHKLTDRLNPKND